LSAATGIAPNDCHFIELALKIQLSLLVIIISSFTCSQLMKL